MGVKTADVKTAVKKHNTKKEKLKKNVNISKSTSTSQPKNVETKEETSVTSSKVPESEISISDASLKKIEKKKAKKLAQKLKRAQGKETPVKKDLTKPTLPKRALDNEKKVKKTKLKKDKQTAENDAKEATTGVGTNTPTKEAATPVTERVLLKKERKIKKRQLLKDKKLLEKSTRDPATDEATVFVGNVPVNTKRVQLVRLFKDYGPVNSIRLRSAGGKILHKHKMRKSAGSLNAYVVLKNKSAAENALKLNGTEFKGNHLRVTKSDKNAIAEMNDETKRTVFVGNLKYSATEESLREIFSSCGEVEYVRCLRDGDKGCKGVAYVCFKSTDAIGLALELNETILDERPIHVECFSTKKLGAKEQRDAQAAKTNKAKQQKGGGDKPPAKGKNGKGKIKSGPRDESAKTKKSEFRGVKVDALKKKLKMKKKKSNSQASDMIKKIAPKTLKDK